LLATYLALIVGGLAALGRSQRWQWRGALAIAGGFGWSLLLLITGASSPEATLANGLLTLLLAAAFPLLLAGETARWLRLIAAFAGCLQMAALVANGGFAGLDWALYGLIAVTMVWLSRREPLLVDAPLAGITIGLLLAFDWDKPAPITLAAVLAGGALIHGGPALLRLWRADGRLGDAAQIALAALGIGLVPFYHFDGQASDMLFAGLSLTGAAIAGAAAAIGWRNPARSADARFAMLALTAIALVWLSGAILAPTAWLAPATAVAALLALVLARQADDRRIEIGARVYAVLALPLLALPWPEEIARPFGAVELAPTFAALVRWSIVATASAGFMRWSIRLRVRQIAAAATIVLGYAAIAQVMPLAELPLIPAAMLVALAFASFDADLRLVALTAAGAIATCWTVEPLLRWLAAGGPALLGEPVYVTVLSTPHAALFRLGAPALALAVLLWRRALPGLARDTAAAALAVLAVITAHVVWKQVFAIATPPAFIAWGMAERSLWEMLLLAAALAAWRLGWRAIALGLAGASLAHFGWFTLVVHDPLWAEQAIGPWLVPAYASAWAATWLIVRLTNQPAAARAETGVQIVLILLFAATGLRQIFHGSIVAGAPLVQAEDIGRSLIAILLALGFLYRGIARADRDWRIASLVLMLVAVGKVFLFDAAGLAGLLRIGSFVALGLSLILVGWLYSRFLPDARLTGALDAAGAMDDQARG
jgi:uncharacterized membrane protein